MRSLGLLVSLSACSMLPASVNGPASSAAPATAPDQASNTSEAAASSDSAPTQPHVCAKAFSNATPESWESIVWSGDRSIEKAVRAATAARRDQWVSVRKELTDKWTDSPAKRNPKPGEPLLLMSCSDYGFTVVTADFDMFTSLPFDALDPAPRTFAFPAKPHTLLELKGIPDGMFDPDKTYGLATREDFDAVPRSREIFEKSSGCRDSAIGACQAAEQDVAPGPRYEERRSQACSKARERAMVRCIGAMGKSYEKVAMKLKQQQDARLRRAFDAIKQTLH